MSYLKKSGFLKHIFKSAPLIILFIAVLNEFDANYFGIPFLSVNLAFILIFFWTLKNIEQFGYGYIFLAGIINDVVTAQVSTKDKRLRGANITLKYPSVGATETILMASCLAFGKTTISNPARAVSYTHLTLPTNREV